MRTLIITWAATGALLLALMTYPAAAAGPPAMPIGDAEKGAKAYESRCSGCHALDANRVGPKHRGVFGRKAGSIADFNYSPALKKSKVVWSETTLDKWLSNPQSLIPGQRMNFRLGDAAMRADIIAFLKRESPPAPAQGMAPKRPAKAK